jgi:hypothetical protein
VEARSGAGPAGSSTGVGTVVGVRLQEFWSRMERQFGPMRAQSVSRDHVFGPLGGRTAIEAIEAGVPIRTVWLEICKEYDVPPKDR